MISAYLFDDHRKIDALFSRLLRDVDECQAGSLQDCVAALIEGFEAVHTRLERHMRWEEEVVFPAAEERMPELAQGPGQVMRSEHSDIRAYLREVQDRFAAGEFDEDARQKIRWALRAAEGVLAEHNEKEEQVYYPLCDSQFTAEEAGALLERMQAIR